MSKIRSKFFIMLQCFYLNLVLIFLFFPFFLKAQNSSVQASPVQFSEGYIIKFKPVLPAGVQVYAKTGLSAKDSALAEKQGFEKGRRIIAALKGIEVHQQMEKLGLMHLKNLTSSKLEFLKAHPDVEYIEPNTMLSLEPDYSQQNPNQNLEAMASNYQSTDFYRQSSVSGTQVRQAWAIMKSPAAASKTVVAVIDSGLDLSHAVFADSDSIWQNQTEVNGLPGVDDDNNGYIDDFNGWNFVNNSGSIYDDNRHGTHVAGIVVGVSFDIGQSQIRESSLKIMPLKFLDASGSGSTANAISAIYYAVNNGAKVINNSWGGPTYSRALQDAYKYAYDNNVVLVTAAGNSSYNLDTTPMYPAALDTPSNITVSADGLNATTMQERRSSYSNYSSTKSHVYAPGDYIDSTIPGSCSNPYHASYFSTGVCFKQLSGTSMASPFVAGLAGLLRREAPQLSAYQIKNLITANVDVMSNLSTVATSGRVNVYKSIQSAQSSLSVASYQPAYSPVYKSDASSVAAAPNPDSVAGCGLVKTVMNSSGGGSGPLSGAEVFKMGFLFLILISPFYLAQKLKRQTYTRSQRKYERFELAKNLVIEAGEQVITSASQTLALGGLSFQADAQLSKGQKVMVRIDGLAEAVEGEIVWSVEQKAFGVKFNEITETLKDTVQSWTAGLKPTT